MQHFQRVACGGGVRERADVFGEFAQVVAGAVVAGLEGVGGVGEGEGDYGGGGCGGGGEEEEGEGGCEFHGGWVEDVLLIVEDE